MLAQLLGLFLGALDQATVKEDPLVKLRALREEFAQRAKEKAQLLR